MKYSTNNKPIVCMQTQSTCYKGTTVGKPVGILWHDTGAGNPYIKRYVQPSDNDANRASLLNLLGKNAYANDWNHISHQAGLNAWVGKLADGTVATVQSMPWNYRPWGCGSGSKGSCNGSSSVSNSPFWIQFEICDDGYGDASYFAKAYKEACELTAYLCKLYGINPNGTVSYNGVTVPTILCHQDSYRLGLGSNHGDVYLWFNKYGKTMANVRSDVAALLGSSGGSGSGSGSSGGSTTATFKAGDVVKITGSTYYNGKSVPEWVKAKSWIVHSASGDRVVINKSEDGVNSIMSPFKASDLALKNAPQTPAVSGTASTGSDADKKTFHDFFMGKLNNEFGVAGLWGNIFAESGGRSNNLQNAYETKLGYTDATYTTAVDNGSYTNFVKDSAGYGLAQWTYYTRKQALLDYAKNAKKSVGDYATQLAFLYKELSENYAAVLNTLKGAKTVKEASDAVLTQFERPADMSDAVKTKRAVYGQEFYNKFVTTGAGAGSVVTTEPSTGGSGHSVLRKGSTGDEVKELQQKLTTLGYSLGAIDGDFGDKTLAAVKKFQSDYSLDVDGVVGNQTWTALDNAVAAKSSVPYVVRVTTDALNIRKGSGTNYAIVGCIRDRGAYTIVEEKAGTGASKWGLLKAYASGKNGWISLDYVKKV